MKKYLIWIIFILLWFIWISNWFTWLNFTDLDYLEIHDSSWNTIYGMVNWNEVKNEIWNIWVIKDISASKLRYVKNDFIY